MNFAFPYFGFPSFRRYHTNRTYVPKQEVSKSTSDNLENKSAYAPKNLDTSCDNEKKVNEKREYETKKPLKFLDGIFDGINNGFDVFGIHLDSDDFIIIGLLFLLYTEGVKDQSLFISLIMLLLDR